MIEYTVKVYANDDKFWYLNGEQLTEQEHAQRTGQQK